jgi:nucleotide-binding universal stress UspA family protein
MVRDILTTTDFSDESMVGTNYAMKLAKKLGATVVLLHVVEPLPAIEGMEAFPLLPTPAAMKKQARAHLKSIAGRTNARRMRLIASVRTAKPFHGIVAEAGERGADLIVMATHGYTGVDHLLLGSTAERVVRHAPCSVLTVPVHAENRRRNKSQALKFTRLLVPLDFSEISKTALPWATFLAGSFDAEVILFNVTEKYPIDYLMGRELMNQAITPLMKDAEAALQRIAQNLNRSTGIKASVVVRDGTPYKEICHAADELGADLIALTTHGYTGLKHVWLGSTAERVVRHARCPVLIVRDKRTSPVT